MTAQLGWVNYISINGAEPISLDALPPEQRKAVNQAMSERISRVLSLYVSNHPEELQSLFHGEAKDCLC